MGRVIVLVLACLACLAVGVVAFVFGGCHDGGGWLCADEYTATNTQAYAVAAVFGGLALVFATGLVRRNGRTAAAAFAVGAALVALAAYVTEGRA